MFPRRQSASFVSPTDNEKSASTGPDPGPGNSPFAQERVKPLLGVIDDGLIAREDEFPAGVSLLHVGNGVDLHDYPRVLEGLDQPGTSRAFLPSSGFFGLQTNVPAPPPMMESETSEMGASFSVPTEVMSSNNISQGETHFQAQVTPSASDIESLCIFPRHYEFSWGASSLMFAGEPFDVDRSLDFDSSRANSDSAVGSQDCLESFNGFGPHSLIDGESDHLVRGHLGIGLWGGDGSVACQDASDVSLDLETASTECDSDCIGDPYLNPDAPGSTAVFFAWEETIRVSIKLLLEDFIRSYAPQRRGERSGTSTNQSATFASDTGGETSESNTQRSRGKRPSRRRIADEYDESGSEDPDPGRHGASGTTLFESLLCMTCPFLRWQPQLYRDKCMLKICDISQLKRHLKSRHYKRHCGRCYVEFGKGEPTDHGCFPRPAPPGLITREMQEEIETYANRTITTEEQSAELFTLIFSNAPMQCGPFFDYSSSKIIRDTSDYIRSEHAMKFLMQVLKQRGYEDRESARLCKIVREDFLPKVIPDCLLTFGSRGKKRRSVEELARDDDQVDKPVCHSPKLVSATIDPAVLEDMSGDNLQKPSDLDCAFLGYPDIDREDQFVSTWEASIDQHGTEYVRGIEDMGDVEYVGGVEDLGDWSLRNAAEFGESGERNSWDVSNGWTGLLGEDFLSMNEAV